MPVGPLLVSLSILMAMGYRRAPMPISPDVVRWFVNRSAPPSADELAKVARLCLLLGDHDLVLRELRRSQTAAQFAAAPLWKNAQEISNPAEQETPGGF